MNCLQARTQAVCSRKQILLSPPLTQIHTSICTYNQSPPHPPTHKYIPARAHTNPSFLLSVSYKYIPLLEKRNPSLSCYHTNTYCYLHKEILALSPAIIQIHTGTCTKKSLSPTLIKNAYQYFHKQIPLPLSHKYIPILPQTNPSLSRSHTNAYRYLHKQIHAY